MDDLFGTVAGLPLHPLVVHAAVVLLPLSALSLLVALVLPWWRTRFAGATVVGLTLAAGAAFVAKESGEWLGGQIGIPADHARWADILVPVALATWLLAVLWYAVQRRGPRVPTLVAAVVGGLSGLGALAGLVLAVLVGHSGATATWGDLGVAGVGESSAAAATTPSGAATTGTSTTGASTTGASTSGTTSTGTATSGTASTGTAPATAGSGGYTFAQVQQHASTSSCWAVIDGSVYDLTSWISAHPGGPGVITGLCGTDATGTFTAKHGTQALPAERLAGLKIGAFAG